MRLEPALQQQDKCLDALAKDTAKLYSAVKKWKSGVANGEVATLEKNATLVVELARKVTEAAQEAKSEWTFDVKQYLASHAWMVELEEVARESGATVGFRDEEEYIIPPLVLSARVSQESLLIGKERLKILRPTSVLRLMSARLAAGRASASQEFLEQLYQVWKRQPAGSALIKFRDAYDTFCLAPGWKKENSKAQFGQQIYALNTSDIRMTRSGATFNVQEPSAKVGASDVFEARGKDGRPIRYYGISFQGGGR